MLLQTLLMPGQGQTQTVLHLLCSINMEDFRLYSFIPSLKLLLLLPVTAKGYTVSALERVARGRDSGMSGLSLPRCHFRSGPGVGTGGESVSWPTLGGTTTRPT